MGPYIDPWQLEIVLVMAEELNTHKAAERLKVHQSTVSKGIKKFEKEQELTVFVREGKRIADLTPEGEQFLEHIKPAFHVFQSEAARASEIAEMILRRSAGAFMFGYSPLAPAAMLSEVRSVRKCTVSGTPSSGPPTETLGNICLGSIWPASGRTHLRISATARLGADTGWGRTNVRCVPSETWHPPPRGDSSRRVARAAHLCAVFGSRAARALRMPGIGNAPGEDSLRRLWKKRIPRDRLSISCLIEEASPSCRSVCMLEHRQI